MSQIIELRNKRRKNKNFMGKYLLIIACILAVLLAIVTRIFTIEEIEIEGNVLYSNDEIIQILKINERSNIINVYMNARQNYIDYPYIDSVEIKYEGYNKIKIKVHEKQIVGSIFYMSNYMCIDKDGFVVDYVKETDLDPEIPIIEGLDVDALIMGEKINLPQEMIDTCLVFYQTKNKYGFQIKRIIFEDGSLNHILLKINNLTVDLGEKKNINLKIQFIQKMMAQIPEGEFGTLYLDEDGRSGYYEKNIN